MNCTQGHNHSAILMEIIEKIKRDLARLNLSRIFLCTDEEAIVKKMQDEFGDAITVLGSYRSQGGNQGIHLEKQAAVSRENHKYQLGFEVLRDAYLMSQCRAIICGKSNVAYAAIVLNNNQFANISYTN